MHLPQPFINARPYCSQRSSGSTAFGSDRNQSSSLINHRLRLIAFDTATIRWLQRGPSQRSTDNATCSVPTAFFCINKQATPGSSRVQSLLSPACLPIWLLLKLPDPSMTSPSRYVHSENFYFVRHHMDHSNCDFGTFVSMYLYCLV